MTNKLVGKKSIAYKLQELVWSTAKEFDKSLKIEDIHLEHPGNPEHGDYASNIALAIFSEIKNKKLNIENTYQKSKKKKFKNPLELAKLIVKNLPKADYLEKTEVVKPGFINFWLSKECLGSQLERVLKKKDEFGRITASKRKKTMVEFAHPNTHKPFHIGHLRNICLGEALVRILEVSGAQIIRANYQGDVGLHIAKCLWKIKYQKLKMPCLPAGRKNLRNLDKKIEFLGKAYAEGNKAYEEDDQAKKEIIKINEQIYNQDPKIMPLWRKTRQWSLDYFDRIYKKVYTTFDRLYFESEVAGPGKEIVFKNLKKKIFEKSQGAIVFNGEKYGLHKRVFVNKLGFPTYEAKDMGLGALQFSEFSPDLIVHVVGPEQKGYFEVVFKALEQIFPKTKGKEFHLIYGWVRLKKGKMSSRTGQVILGEWLIDEVKKRLTKEFKMDDTTAEIVAVGAVKFSFLKFSPQKEIAFDIDESINMEGDSGPYLQYTYARCKSVLRKAKTITKDTPLLQRSILCNPEEMAILRTIYKFPEVVLQAGENYAPNLICNFLFDLAQKYNAFYNKWPILKPERDTSDKNTSEVKSLDLPRRQAGTSEVKGNTLEVEKIKTFRLALTAVTSQILKTGLNLLGIKVLEKM